MCMAGYSRYVYGGLYSVCVWRPIVGMCKAGNSRYVYGGL